MHNGEPLTNETVVDETWFSTPDGCNGKIGVCINTYREILYGNSEFSAFSRGRQIFFNPYGDLDLSIFSCGEKKDIFLFIDHIF